MSSVTTSRRLAILAEMYLALPVFFGTVALANGEHGESIDAKSVASQVDERINEQLQRRGILLSPRTSDAEFLRRSSLDITGRLPTPEEIARFAHDSDSEKRPKLVERLLQSDGYARNRARYWRDAILYRATDARAQRSRRALEDWFFEQFSSGRGWDAICTDLITATGDVATQGNTALVVAQMAQAEELAAETSRLFLGIQIQCAQCHDHPYDAWTRDQFHQLAAYFPRVRIQRQQDADDRRFKVVSADGNAPGRRNVDPARRFARLDSNGDGKAERAEVPERLQRQFDQLVRRADKDQDKALTFEELKEALARAVVNRRQRLEHYMPDLEHPDQPGTLVHPAFFVTGESMAPGSSDLDRRRALAASITSEQNPWFVRAFVNRVWTQMMGQGFTEPVDDMGPNRPTVFADVLDLLAEGFRANSYDVRWLIGTIAATAAYQRQDRPRGADPDGPRFAAVCPTRMRADPLFDHLVRVLDLNAVDDPARNRNARNRRRGGVRGQFAQLFGYDPSMPAGDVVGTIPQALFLMNSPVVNRRIRAQGDTPLARILKQYDQDERAVVELYLQTLAREPSPQEIETCLEYVREVGKRDEAFEDILWSLLNSSEFLTRR